MKKVLLTSTAIAAFVAFSGTAVAQDPGRADFGATEGGGGSGSAFTVKTNGAVKFYLKYSGPDPDDAQGASPDNAAGFFTIVGAELEINGAATTDDGTDISTHIDLDFSGHANDSRATVGGTDNTINVGNNVRAQELSLKIGGDWGSVELGHNDGAEDTVKIYGASVAAGTGGIDGDLHSISNVVGSIGGGGTAGGGDSGDALKVTYRTPVFAGVELGYSLAYAPDSGPGDANGGTLGHGFGIKYSGKGGGVSYAVSLVYGDTTLAHDGSAGASTYSPSHYAGVDSTTDFGEYKALIIARGLTDHHSTITTGTGINDFLELENEADERTIAPTATVVATADNKVQFGNFTDYLAVAIAEEDANVVAGAAKGRANLANADANGGLGVGAKIGVGGFSAALGITYDNLGVDEDAGGDASTLAFSAGVAYAIPDSGANVSLTGGATDLLDLEATGYQVVASADYAVLPGVTIATDLGYGDSDVSDDVAGAIQWGLRVKAAF